MFRRCAVLARSRLPLARREITYLVALPMLSPTMSGAVLTRKTPDANCSSLFCSCAEHEVLVGAHRRFDRTISLFPLRNPLCKCDFGAQDRRLGDLASSGARETKTETIALSSTLARCAFSIVCAAGPSLRVRAWRATTCCARSWPTTSWTRATRLFPECASRSGTCDATSRERPPSDERVHFRRTRLESPSCDGPRSVDSSAPTARV